MSEHEKAVQKLLEQLVALAETNTTATIAAAITAGIALVIALVALLA